MTELNIATPEQMVEAWECGAMHGYATRARDEVRRNPIPEGMVDPTYHRNEDGWSSAKEITNPSAIYAMRGYLQHGLGVRAPEETEQAWERTLAMLAVRTKVELAVNDVIREEFRAALVGGYEPTVADYNVAVRNALWKLAEEE